MTILQATGGVAFDEIVDAARTFPSEVDRLFDCNLDTYTPGNSHDQRDLTLCCGADGLTLLFQKASKLAMRLDSCCSQVLGFAITTIRMTLLLASQGVTQQREVLEYAFAQQNFLISIASFLSTQVWLFGVIAIHSLQSSGS